jgi:sulfur carrier protein
VTATARVNGVERRLEPGTTVSALVRSLGVESARGVAVALDGAVVPSSAWKRTEVRDGQELEILRAVQGG